MWLLWSACHRPLPTPVVGPPRLGVTGSTVALVAVLQRFGAIVVPIDPDDGDPDLGSLDGLVLGPGDDLDPTLYGQALDPTDVLVDRARQDQDLALARAALDRDLPLLGVCLGAQELAVALGGSLIQDLPTQNPAGVDHRAPHRLDVVAGTPLAGWYGAEPIVVVSNHHQAVDRVPDGLTVAARAPDGVVEAVVVRDRKWAVGLQFHPEVDDTAVQDPLWTALVAAARR